MDWSEKAEKVLCIKCNEGENLLVCSENGCLLAVHEGCLSYPARFDDAGCYYCPYCCYKRAVAESHKAREYALAKKTALLVFTDGSKGAESYGHNEKISKADRDQSVQPEKEVDNAEEEKVQKDDSEGQDPSPKLHEEQGIGNEVDKSNQEENHGISNEETRNQEDGGKKNQEEEHVPSAAPKRSKQPEKPPLKLGRKRKGQFWTEAEEEALKAGVAKFSKEPIVNIPWRKILLMGVDVFDAYRTPSDLKDKWKRMNRSK